MSHKDWYAEGLRFECSGCGNCCRNHGGYSYVYLNQNEVAQISAHLGLEQIDFLSEYCVPADGYISLRMDQPACPFLDEGNRCSIYSVRPTQCRTWPFWTENLNPSTWESEVRTTCPGVGRGRLFSAEEIAAIARTNDESCDD